MSMNLLFVIKQNFLNNDIDIINFIRRFQYVYRRHFDLVSKYNVGLKHFFCKDFLNLNFMATWCTNSEI